MVFKVHVRMARTAHGELAAKNMKIGRRAFVFGNIFPDLLIPHVPRHRKQCSQDFFDRLYSKIRTRHRKNVMKIHVWDSFLLGVLSHYAADYSCITHKADYTEGIRTHMRHERALFKYLKSNPHTLSASNLCPVCEGPCTAAQFGTRNTEGFFDELVEAMDAVRLVCAGAVPAAQ